MICKRCANIFSDDLTACPDCGEPVKASLNADADVMNEDIDRVVSLAMSDDDIILYEPKKDFVQDEYEDVFSEEGTAEEYQPQPEAQEEVQEEVHEEPEEEAPAVSHKIPVKKGTGKKEKVVLKKMGKKEKGAFNFVIALMAVVFIGMGALVGVSLKTDVFKSDSTAIKTVAFTGLSSAHTEELETYLEKISVIAYNGFDKEKVATLDILDYMRPDSMGGLLTKFYGKAEIVASKADPNARFMNKNEDFSFYQASEQQVDDILKSFGAELNHTVNEKDYYFYDGNYYFANVKNDNLSGSIVAEISSSKRIQNGKYYVECNFYDEASEKEDKNLLKSYIILDKQENAETGEINWIIDSISHEPVFDEAGFMIEKNAEESQNLSYTLKTETFENVTKDGVVYSKFTVEYPVFEGATEGERAANLLVSAMIEGEKKSKSETGKAYRKYLKKGGKEDELPHVVDVKAEVTYNSNGYISIVQTSIKDKPDSLYSNKKQKIGGKKIKVANLPEREVVSYTFKSKTGEFVTMTDIITADKELVEEVLYRIYNDYSYKGLLKKNPTDSKKIPEDKKGLGEDIYKSASAMSENGYIFCYVNPKGYAETVTIPYDVNKIFSKSFKKAVTEVTADESK